MKMITLNTGRIEAGLQFSYHYDLSDNALKKSIQAMGIVNPLILIENKQCQLIDGHRRLKAAKAVGIEEVPGLLYPRSKIEKIFTGCLGINMAQENLTTIEKLRAIYIAEKRFSAECRQKNSEVLGMQRIPGLYQLSEQVMSLSNRTQKYLHRHNLSLRSLRQLLSYSEKEFERWFYLADDLNLKGTELLKLLEQIQDICLRDNIHPENLFHENDAREILNSERTPQQKAQAIKAFIFIKRFPLLTKIRKLVGIEQKKLEKLMDETVQIDWDQTLENPGIQLTLTMKNRAQLEDTLHKLKSEEIELHLIKMLDKMNQLLEEDS